MTCRLSICLLLALGMASPVWAQPEFVARVLTVHEGDRLTIHHQGRKTMVYLRNVDCPELKQPYGKQAKHATAAYIANREVVIRALTQDRQGRMTADVLLQDGRNVSHELVKEGLAWVRLVRTESQSLNDLEELARASGKGLWADPNPLPPWKWIVRPSVRQR